MQSKNKWFEMDRGSTIAIPSPPLTELDDILLTGDQQAVGISENLIVIIPQLYVADGDPDNGIHAVSYNTETEEWVDCGVAHDGHIIELAPGTARINSNFAAYYSSWVNNNDYLIEYMRLHVFENGSVTDYNLWTANYTSLPIQTQFPEAGNLYNSDIMDAKASGLIACLAYLYKENGVTKNCWAIKVSVNKGVTWKSTYYFPTMNDTYYPSAKVRIDDSGVIWVALVDNENFRLMIYKSPDAGDSWSLVHTEYFGTDEPYVICYTVDYTGQYQYFNIEFASGRKLYRSSDYGVTWEVARVGEAVRDTIPHVSNAQYVNFAYYAYPSASYLKRSIDYGSNFSQVTPPAAIDTSWQDIQSYKERIVYTECGEFFGGSTMGLFYSINNGETWTILNIPTSF